MELVQGAAILEDVLSLHRAEVQLLDQHVAERSRFGAAYYEQTQSYNKGSLKHREECSWWLTFILLLLHHPRDEVFAFEGICDEPGKLEVPANLAAVILELRHDVGEFVGLANESR